MIILWLLFGCSLIVLPITALLALRWAARHGEFDNLSRTALSIFDEDEPVGRQTDFFPGAQAGSLENRSPATTASIPLSRRPLSS